MADVVISVAAQQEFAALPLRIQARVLRVFERLQDWPDVSGAKPLRGGLHGHFRVRTGDFRIVFAVRGEVVTVTRIGNRKDVYLD